jgi:hypothetical protein
MAEPLRPVNGMPIDVTTGAPITSTNWTVDHIVSRAEIAADPRFAALTPLQQLDLLLDVPENYLPLTRSVNSSKGPLSIPDWLRGRPAGRAIRPDIAKALLAAHARAKAAIDARFRSFAQPGQ